MQHLFEVYTPLHDIIPRWIQQEIWGTVGIKLRCTWYIVQVVDEFPLSLQWCSVYTLLSVEDIVLKLYDIVSFQIKLFLASALDITSAVRKNRCPMQNPTRSAMSFTFIISVKTNVTVPTTQQQHKNLSQNNKWKYAGQMDSCFTLFHQLEQAALRNTLQIQSGSNFSPNSMHLNHSFGRWSGTAVCVHLRPAKHSEVRLVWSAYTGISRDHVMISYVCIELYLYVCISIGT